MLIKGMFLFLAFMGVLGIFGKLRLPQRLETRLTRCETCGKRNCKTHNQK